MISPSPLHSACAFAAAFVAGGINSVAGGGSMISFPVLIVLGVPPLIANATNTVGIWPGAVGSLWGFRAEFARVPKIYHWLLLPALLGSAFGAILLRHTSADFFEHIVPALILFATVMFMAAPMIRERLPQKPGSIERSFAKISFVVILQIAVSIYGGYFGAGMSILMLSILSMIGMTDLLVMNAMTSFLSLAINGIASVIFAFSRLVQWPYAITMALGATLGGYLAAGVARKVGAVWIRRLVIAVGFSLAIVMLVRILYQTE